jgi:hypothetical protein
MGETQALPAFEIEHLIYTVRNQRIILDSDLAAIYGMRRDHSIRRSNAILNGFLQISCSDSQSQK